MPVVVANRPPTPIPADHEGDLGNSSREGLATQKTLLQHLLAALPACRTAPPKRHETCNECNNARTVFQLSENGNISARLQQVVHCSYLKNVRTRRVEPRAKQQQLPSQACIRRGAKKRNRTLPKRSSAHPKSNCRNIALEVANRLQRVVAFPTRQRNTAPELAT